MNEHFGFGSQVWMLRACLAMASRDQLHRGVDGFIKYLLSNTSSRVSVEDLFDVLLQYTLLGSYTPDGHEDDLSAEEDRLVAKFREQLNGLFGDDAEEGLYGEE